MEQNSLRLEDTTNIDIGTLWLAFSKAKTVIQHAQRLENLSWRSWQQEMQTHKKPSLNLILLIVNEIQPDQVHKTSIKQTDKKLQPPPTIISIAPTPPSASPAITAPTSPISVPVLPSPIPEQQPSHLLLSPHPQSYQQQQLTPSSNSNSPTDNPFDHPSKPAQPHIGRSTSPILRSNPQSTQSQSSHHPRRSLQDDKAHHDHPKNNLHHIPRRATSSVDFKRKRRPISTTPRPHSHQSTSHSVTPHLAPTPTPPQSLWIKDQNQPTTSSFSSPEQSQDFSKPLDLTQSTNLTVPSQTQTHSNPSSTTSHNQHSKDQHPHSHDVDSQTTPSAGYNSSGSLPSVVSPIIPVTPNNSQVTAPFQIAQDIIPDSLASSHTTGRSSAFMPSAPPPTPSQNGAPLPTTMSAALKNKPQLAQHQGPLLPSTLSPINTTTGGGKKKAKFFIKEYEADDDKTFSPTSFTAQPTQSIQAFTQMAINPTQHTSPPGPVMTISPEKQEPKNAQVSIERQEELEGTDSDEWGSEYSDDEGNEAEELAERAKAQELEKKRKQEEYHRQLFAKKHFVQRNLSHDGRQEPPPIRRAGLSMLFHPELNHLQHHPTSGSGGAGDGGGPLRNQSAVELRRHGSASLSSRKPGDQEPAPGPRSSIGSIPRPSSLIKSKSSVAVPVLAGQDPPVMVQRSPSSHSGQSSLLRQSHRPPTRRNSAAPNGGAAGTTTPGPLPPTRSLPHPAHQRHPSRLGGKPENVEYSDDDSSSEGSQTGQRPGQSHAGAQMTEEQERRLGRLAGGARTGPITLGGGGGAGSNGRPEPIAPPLSPRTTRRNMLANEMTESVRRNLLWERHMRAQALGIALPALPDHRVELPTLPHLDHPASTNLPFTHASNTAVFPPTSTNTTTTTTTTTQFKKNIANGNKEYRNFSKGFHRTGW